MDELSFPLPLKWEAENFLKNYIGQVRLAAEELLAEPLPELTDELFGLFWQTGNRLLYEAAYFARRKLLAVYGMALLLPEQQTATHCKEGAAVCYGQWGERHPRREDIHKLEEIISSVCEEECWALPAHVNREQDVSWRHTVDLFAAETAQALAEITTLGREHLPEKLCARVKKEVEERVLIPFFTSEPLYSFWEGCGHNWNAVCAGAIGSAVLYLWKEEQKLPEYIRRLTASLTHYVDGFEADGACMEGIGYFTYGMTYYTGFAKQLLDDGMVEENLLQSPKLKEIAQFQQKLYFQGGKTVSFSDGDMQAHFRMGLTLFLAGQYEGVEVPELTLACGLHSDNCYRFMGLYRDYLWTKEFLRHGSKAWEKEEKEGKAEEEGRRPILSAARHSPFYVPRHSVLPAAQWSICESKNGAGMAAKGGTNAEPHNHNDIASFLYLVGEEVLFTDLGAGEYTKDYFGSKRYETLCTSSLGHSVPIVNGTLQLAGGEHKAGEFFADGNGMTQIEFAAAYERGLLRRAVRRLCFDLDTGTLAIEDSFEAAGLLEAFGVGGGRSALEKGKLSITEQLVTQCAVTMAGNRIVVAAKEHACMVVLPDTADNVRCVEKLHKNHEGGTETVRLIRWELPEGRAPRMSFQIIPMQIDMLP